MAAERVLLIDGQLFQSSAFHRGIGKYSLALLGELDKVTDFYKEKIILINKRGFNKDDLATLKSALSTIKILELDFELIDPEKENDYDAITQNNKVMLDTYIETHHKSKEIDFLIMSLFHETECPAFPSVCRGKYIIAFDLIPLQFPDLYLHDPGVRRAYLSRYKVLNEADHFFPISRTVATDLTLHLGIPVSNITPIYGAQIKRKQLTPVPVDALKGKEFILLPTGDDYRKNNRRAVQAFNEFNKMNGSNYTLVITSFFSDHTKAELNAHSDALYFSGNVTEAELSWLYDTAELVLFPSEYEGLGMPVLEAVEFMKPIVCSDVQVFRELSSTAFTFCDPYSVDSITAALHRAERAVVDKKEYKKILEQYSWIKTASLMADCLRDAVPIVRIDQELRVAIFAPAASGFSAIGKIVQEQHYVLSKKAKVDYYLEYGVSEQAKATNLRVNFLEYISPVYSPLLFDETMRQKYDKVIYHIGNGEYHAVTLARALSYPDTVILHDTDIEGLYNVARAAGIITTSRLEAERNLEKLVKPKKGHFLSSLVSKQKSVIVHSRYARDAVSSALVEGSRAQIIQENLPSQELYYASVEPEKNTLVVGMAGIIHQDKGLSLVTDIAGKKIDGKQVKIKIFGFSLLDEKQLQLFESNPNIELVRSPSDMRFAQELSHCDVVINYRPNYHGETSLSTLETLRLGKEVVVNDAGWFAELPDGIGSKVGSIEQIPEAIKKLAEESVADRIKDAKKRIAYIAEKHPINSYIDRQLEVKK